MKDLGSFIVTFTVDLELSRRKGDFYLIELIRAGKKGPSLHVNWLEWGSLAKRQVCLRNGWTFSDGGNTKLLWISNPERTVSFFVRKDLVREVKDRVTGEVLFSQKNSA